MYTSEQILEKRKSIHLLQHYLYAGKVLYLVVDINEYDPNPEKWTISLMRIHDRDFAVRDFTVFLDLLDNGSMKFTEVKPA